MFKGLSNVWASWGHQWLVPYWLAMKWCEEVLRSSWFVSNGRGDGGDASAWELVSKAVWVVPPGQECLHTLCQSCPWRSGLHTSWRTCVDTSSAPCRWGILSVKQGIRQVVVVFWVCFFLHSHGEEFAPFNIPYHNVSSHLRNFFKLYFSSWGGGWREAYRRRIAKSAIEGVGWVQGNPAESQRQSWRWEARLCLPWLLRNSPFHVAEGKNRERKGRAVATGAYGEVRIGRAPDPAAAHTRAGVLEGQGIKKNTICDLLRDYGANMLNVQCTAVPARVSPAS